MARTTGRKFDMRVAREWRNRYLGGETCMSIGRSVEPPLSDSMVYYHISKFGALPEKKRGPVPKPPAPRVEDVKQAFDFSDLAKQRKEDARRIMSPATFNKRYMQQWPAQPAEKSMFGAPDLAVLMAGRARIPRRVERMQGVEA